MNFGADGYINKIGDTETVYGELAHCIRQSVEKKRVEQALRESDIRLKKLSSQASGMLYQFMIRPNGTFCVLRRKLTGLICSFSGPYLTAFSFDAQHLFYLVNSLVLESGTYCRETVMRFLLRLLRISLFILVLPRPLLA